MRSDRPKFESSIFHLGLTWKFSLWLHFYITKDETERQEGGPRTYYSTFMRNPMLSIQIRDGLYV